MGQPDILDEILLLSEGKGRRLDCVLLLEADKVPDREELKKGAVRAQQIFAKTAPCEITISEEANLNVFLERPLKNHLHIEEAIIGNTLALKMSHVLGDGVAILLWFMAQMNQEVSSNDLELRTFKKKKNTPYKNWLPSEKWPSPGSRSDKKRIFRVEFTHPKNFGSFSVNDVLSLAILNALPIKRKALWVPVNVRKNTWEGFGNGISRLRVYPPKSSLTLREQLNHIKKQKLAAWKNGEIFLPPEDFKLSSLNKILLKMFINRPWADWGSIALSHLHLEENAFPFANKLWGIPNIPLKQNAGLFAFTRNENSFLTLVIDENVMRPEVSHFVESLKRNFESIKSEL